MIHTDFTSTYVKFRKKEDVCFLIKYKTHCMSCHSDFEHKDSDVNGIFLSIKKIYEEMCYIGSILRNEKCSICGKCGLEHTNISIALYNKNKEDPANFTSTYVEFEKKEDVRFLIKYKDCNKVFYSIEDIYKKMSYRNGEIRYEQYPIYEKGELDIFDISIALYNQNEETEWYQLSYG